jgi:hypothetical protein
MKRGFATTDEKKVANGINNLALIFITGAINPKARNQASNEARRKLINLYQRGADCIRYKLAKRQQRRICTGGF